MSVTFTKEQLNAIESRGGGILVSAAAGSGKTAVLVERIVRRLSDRENPVYADRLLVVTFTRAAAAEMKERIEKRLSELLEKDPDNLFLQQQILLLEHASISTMDSFFSTLVREYAETLSLSPKTRIVDEAMLLPLKQQVMEEILEKETGEEFFRLCRYFGEEGDAALKEEIRFLSDALSTYPYPEAFLRQQEEFYRDPPPVSETQAGKLLLEEGKFLLSEAADALENGKNLLSGDLGLQKAYQKNFSVELDQVRSLLLCYPSQDYQTIREQVFALSFDRLGRAPKDSDLALKETVTFFRNQAKKLIEDAKKLFATPEASFAADLKQQYPLVKKLFSLVTEYRRRLWEEKKERAIADFSDFASLARTLLLREDREPTPVALDYQNRFDEILIDEYQDTNRLQDEIFYAISRQGTNLFFVGDLKQSIYRFRSATPAVFSEKKEHFFPADAGQYPKVIDLNRNFRSRKGVIEGINFLFERLMKKEVGGVDYTAAERLYPGADSYPENWDPSPVEAVWIESEDGVAAEAKEAAKQVRRMLDEGFLVTENGALRPCRPSDFAFLLRSQKNVDVLYAAALKEEGIESVTGAMGSFFGSREISLALSFLRAIDDPADDMALSAVLLSALGGFSCDTLAALLLEKGENSLYAVLRKKGASLPEGSAFFALFDRLREKASFTGVRDFLQYLYDATDLLAIVSAEENGEIREKNLWLLLGRASEYEKGGDREISGFLRFVDRIQEEKRDLDAAVPTTGEDAVSIMTIHKSKGLEFPVVFLLNCGKSFNRMDLRGNTAVDSELCYGMRFIDRDRLVKYDTLPFLALRLLQKKELLSEEMRLLYVAATRAREKLMLFTTVPSFDQALSSAAKYRDPKDVPTLLGIRSGQSFGDWIGRATLGVASPMFHTRRITVDHLEDKAEKEKEKPKEGGKELTDKIRSQFSYHYPHLAATVTPQKLSVTEISHSNSLPLLSHPRFLTEDGFTAAEKGTIFHKALQFSDLEHGRKDPKEELCRLIREEYLSEKEGKVVDLSLWEAFFSSALVTRILASPTVYREYAFFDTVSPKEAGIDGEGEILLQGIADCVFEEDGAGVIVDFKTDRGVSEETLKNRYRLQLSFYRRALEKLFPKGIKEALIYSTALKKEIVV